MRKAFKFIGISLVCCILFILLFIFYAMQERSKFVSRTNAKIKAVNATVVFDLEKCSAEYPLLFSVFNGSNDIVNGLAIKVVGHTVGVRSPGYAIPSYLITYQKFSGDVVYATEREGTKVEMTIPSGQWGTLCIEIPPKFRYWPDQLPLVTDQLPPDSLAWTVVSRYPYFDSIHYQGWAEKFSE